MGRVILIVGLVLAMGLLGCQKGDKGDTGPQGLTGASGTPGTSTLLSSKIYTGTPTTNPYNKVCPEITGASNQIVDIYMCLYGGSKFKLPLNNMLCTHMYSIKSTEISFFTMNFDASAVYTALYDKAWGQATYQIEIRTFATASAAQSYKNRNSPAKSQYDTLIYGSN